MKVLHTVKHAYPSTGGMESVVKDIVEGIHAVDANLDFTVYSNSYTNNIYFRKFLHNDIKYVKERTFGHFKSQPLTVYYSQLAKLIDEHDIIHHHYPFPNMEVNLVNRLTRLNEKKLVITWHANIGQSRWKSLERIYNPMVRKLLDRADSIVVTSPQLLENSTILPPYHDKIEVIPLSYNERFHSGKQKARSLTSGRPFQILFVGRLRAYKGVNVLLQAIKDLNVTLSIVGNGEYGNELRLLVNELNITSKVDFYDDLNDSQVEEMYRNSDLFILPSVNEAEAFGVVQLEAMATGLPVINTNLKSGVPFVSLHNSTGLTVEPKNVLELKNAIELIMNNGELYHLFSRNALERVKEFTREKLVNSYLNLYKR
ncbi:glycosyltransferase [Sphingobacterium siyangense]|uniref:glycosyltransferase n=1 Tax=Sphingobacterium siyangense TaxID=459529 RepID=UPI003DA3D26E